jgi:cell division protein FtsB
MSGQRDEEAGRTARRRTRNPNPLGRASDGDESHTRVPVSRSAKPARPTTAAKGAGKSSGRPRPASRTGAARTRSAAPSRPTGTRAPARPALASRGRTTVPEVEHGGSAWVRGAILLTILVVLAVTLAPTARSLLRQRGEITALQDKVVQQQQSVTDLQREQARWADPAYVEQQARERLKFVKVGDRSYSVIDPATEVPKPPTTAVVAAPQADANAPWYGQVWESVRLADQPSAGMAPVPDR